MGGGGGSSKSTSTVETNIRYAPYVETKHESFLNSVYSYRTALISDSPFDGYDNHVIEDAFFGYGYVIGNFPPLYDMFGKFMAGMDAEALFDEIYEDTVNSPSINNIVKSESALLSGEINNNSLPRLNLGKTNVNACMAGTFSIGESIINDMKTKSVSKFEAQLKYSLIPAAQTRWATHLDWNKSVIDYYSELIKFYYTAKFDVTDKDYSMAASNRLWPFTVLDFERAALGVLQGAVSSSGSESIKGAGTSRTSNALSGALSGAAMGSMFGNAVKPPTSAIQTTGSGAFSSMPSGPQSPVMSSGGGGWGAGIGAALGVVSAFMK